MQEWLEELSFDLVKPEYVYDKSRIDFYMEKNDKRSLLEVKGCTLEINGIGYFPDALTERGVKHLHELAKAVGEGYHAAVAFAIPMPKVVKVLPNDQTQPVFGEALREAEDVGVKVLYLPCIVKPDEVVVNRELAKELNGSEEVVVCGGTSGVGIAFVFLTFIGNDTIMWSGTSETTL